MHTTSQQSPGWKRRVAAAAISGAAPYCVRFLREDFVRVLNYHRINYLAPEFAFDPDVVSATPELFEREVRFCKENFDVISFAELHDAFEGHGPAPKRPLVISFDDGYEDNYSHAYAILKTHRVPAIFFLAANYIGTDRLFWWDAVALALRAAEDPRLTLEVGGGRLVFDLTTPEERRVSTKRLLKTLKMVPNTERERIVDELASRSATRGQAERWSRQTMTWEEAREMAANGMEIGSHTLSHPILSRISDRPTLTHEIAGSKALIESRLVSPVSVFSYPVGGPGAFNATVVQIVKDAGYRSAVTYINGLNRLAAVTDRFSLKRLHVDGLSEAEFKMRLLAPQL